MSDRTRAHVFVSGKVQGVYYRANTRERAQELAVDGWVRNLDDGRVEAVFEGPEDRVEELVEWCHSGNNAEAHPLQRWEEARKLDGSLHRHQQY
jgi:acylphosphatase